MYVVKCYVLDCLVSVLCCKSFEVAELRMKLELLEHPEENCVIEALPLWEEDDIDYLKLRIEEYNNGKEI